MKTFRHILIYTALVFVLCSCSAVFDAGVSGRVYYISKGTEYSISNAKVFVYDNASLSDPIASTRTNANGDYTVNRIVWKTNKGAFGKTADYHTVYIYVEHEDFAMQDNYVKSKIISDSTNTGMADVQMTRTRYTAPTFSGRITTDINTDISSSFDEIEVWLCYKDSGGDYVRFTDSEAKTTTTYTQTGSDTTPYYMHGVFSGLGGGTMKYAQADYPEIWVVADMDGNGNINSGDLVSKASYSMDSETSYTLNGNSFMTL